MISVAQLVILIYQYHPCLCCYSFYNALSARSNESISMWMSMSLIHDDV
jgi:hypothetical protein